MKDDSEKKENMASYVEQFVSESDERRRAHISRADLNNAQYLGDYGDAVESRFGHSAFVLNKTQPAIIAHTQVQIEQRPRTLFTARESSRTEEIWMTRKALNTVRSLIAKGLIESFDEAPKEGIEDAALMLGDEAGAIDAPIEIEEDSQGFVFEKLDESNATSFEVSEAFVERVSPLMAEWQGLDGKIYNPVLKPKDIFTVTDAIGAEIIKNNCDILWDVGNNDSWLFENIHNNNIIGWQFALYQWDADEQKDIVFNLHPKHVWLAAEATSVEDSEGVVIKEPMSKKTAMNRYPDIADKIKKYGGENVSQSEMGSSDVAGPFKDTKFYREMVNVWTAWFRNHKYPMPVEMALDMGKVELTESGYFLLDEDGVSTGEATDPEASNWPKRNGIRQVKVVCGETVEDIECPYWDIPVIQNKNIPMPFRWVAIGEPQRLEWIDKLINKLCSIVFDTLKYGRSQQEIFPSSVWEGLKEQRAKMHSHPARQMHIEDSVYQKFQQNFTGGKGFAIDPPRVPDSAIMFLREMLQLHDVLSGNTAELQGRTSGSGLSGKAIETLQGAARGIIGFKATMTEHMLKRMTRLRVHAMTTRGWLTPRSWKKMNDQFPIEVLDAVRMRAKQLDLDIVVEVASGGGEARKVRQQQAREDFAANLIDAETALEKIDIYPDVKGILARMDQRRQEAMASQQQAAQQAQGQPTPMAA